MAAGSFHPRGQGAPEGEGGGAEPTGKEEVTAPGSVHGAAIREKSFTEQSPAGQQVHRPQRLYNELQFWPRFQWAVKEISLILPEKTEHSTEALIRQVIPSGGLCSRRGPAGGGESSDPGGRGGRKAPLERKTSFLPRD